MRRRLGGTRLYFSLYCFGLLYPGTVVDEVYQGLGLRRLRTLIIDRPASGGIPLLAGLPLLLLVDVLA